MLCVGVDFGSTYTTVSVYDVETGKLEAQTLSEGGTPFIPSVMTVSKGQVRPLRRILAGQRLFDPI